MSMSNIVDVGTPPDDMDDDWTTIVVRFHGFANLSTTRGEKVISPEFSCLGHQWRLDIYPGGRNLPEHVAVSLSNMTNESIKIRYGYSVRDLNGKEVVNMNLSTSQGQEFPAHPINNTWCTHDVAKRSKLMATLVNGALVIEVRMRTLTSTAAAKSITQFIPTNPFNKNVSELFMDEETADVVFELGEPQAKGKRKRTNFTTTFHAHRLILKKCAPTLYEMCGVSSEGGITTVSIPDVKPYIFKHMIYYTYGGKLSVEVLKYNAKDIIDACDKYGVVQLKLEAETCYVKSTEITYYNMMDNLLWADSKNLALLKETVMDYIINNKTSIIGKVSFDKFPSHLVTDLLTAMARGEEQTGDSGEDKEDESAKYVKMRVGTLRKMLDEKGLDVDGSRESMIALLRNHSKPVKSPINPFGGFGSQKPS